MDLNTYDNMSSIVSPLNGKANFLDERSHLLLQDSMRGATEKIETANDNMLRLFNANLEVTVSRVGCDRGLCKPLAAISGSISVEVFPAQNGSDGILFERFFR